MPPRSLVTQSMMATTISCEEKARLRYVEKLATPITGALSVGAAVHKGFEVESATAALDYLVEARGELWTEFEEERLAQDSAIVQAIVEGGLELWDPWPSRPEVEFRVPYVNPRTGHPSRAHTFAGKIDGVFMPGEISLHLMDTLHGDFMSKGLTNHYPVLLEIKTTSRLDASYLDRLDLDWQVSAYMPAASSLYGAPVRQMVYRICRKPQIRPKSKIKRANGLDEKGKAQYLYSPETIEEYAERVREDYRERPDFYFHEVVLTRTDEQIERWLWEAWEVHERILQIQNGAMTLRNVGHCLDFGRCPFFDLCRGVQSPEAFSVLPDPHPELDGTNNEQAK